MRLRMRLSVSLEQGVHLSYDADGNMTSDGRWTYTWNGENRLIRAVEAVLPTNRAPCVVEYAYDHRGRMVCKTIGGTNGPPDKALAYVWDDYNIVRETLTTNHWSLVTHNIWGLDIDGSMQGCGGVGGLLTVVRDGEVYTPTYDANGNISEYMDSSGTIITHQEYDPFGNTIISSGDTAAFTHWFSTKPWCGVTGLYEYQYRKYRPGIGRWMSRDPIGGFLCKALYGFNRNSSYDIFDWLGFSECIEGECQIRNIVKHMSEKTKLVTAIGSDQKCLLSKSYKWSKWKNQTHKLPMQSIEPHLEGYNTISETDGWFSVDEFRSNDDQSISRMQTHIKDVFQSLAREVTTYVTSIDDNYLLNLLKCENSSFQGDQE